MESIESNLYLGTLCKRNHNFNNTGKSLRYKCNRSCVDCNYWLYYTSREKILESQKEYNKKHKEARRRSSRKHYARNREKEIQRRREYRKNNPAQAKKSSREYKLRNKEKVKAYNRQYNKKHREALNQNDNLWRKKHQDQNTEKALCWKLRKRVREALNNYTKTGKIWKSKKYGINYEAIIKHLGPHPNTLGIPGDWHIDHIIPLSVFDLNNLEQIKLAFAPENHQWLLASDNVKKWNKIPNQTNLFLIKQQNLILTGKT